MDTAQGDIDAALIGTGLLRRGGFYPVPEDGAPEAAQTIILIGNAGAAMWDAFAKSRKTGPDPLDAWSREILARAVARLSGTFPGLAALHPSDGPPFFPFQAWALRCGGVHRSRLGILIHPRYGLWHAYRGALVFRQRLALGPTPESPSPCAACLDQPCLDACPANAIGPDRYDTDACRDHVRKPAGEACLKTGCRARHACPVGREYVYPARQAEFHMRGFLGQRP